MASLPENIRKTLNDYDEKILDIYNQIENLPPVPGGGSSVEENEYGGIEINDDNQAISDNAFSFGFGNVAGGKGFKITACSDNGDGTGTYTLSSVDGLVADGSMTYNVRLSASSYNVGVITAINGNVVTVTNYPNIALETDADEPENFNIENYLTITGRPDLGDTDIGFNSFAGGQGNVAQDKNAFSFGKGNKVIGQFGASLGRDNVSGYGCLVGGRGNVVPVICGFGAGQSNKIYSDCSAGFGYNNTINKCAPYSNAFGINNVVNGCGASTIGRGLIASGDYQIILGRYNKEDKDNILVIGGGTSDSDRKNVLMLDKSGILQISKLIVNGHALVGAALTNDYGDLYNIPVSKGNSNNGVAGANGTVKGEFATSLGHECKSLQHHSFSTGLRAKADGYVAISIGTDSQANADYANAMGRGVIASQEDQFVRGRFNKEMGAGYIDIIGNGTNNGNRSNAYTLDKKGNVWFAGDVKAGEISLSKINTSLGDLLTLETVNKTNIVNAINEVRFEIEQDRMVQTQNATNIETLGYRIFELSTSINTVSEDTATINLSHNTETRCSTLTNLTITATTPTDMSEQFISSIKFTSGETATVLEYPEEIKMTGEDCIDGKFVPITNKRYNIIFDFDGVYLIGVVGGVDI